jgi:hypothetical protein
MLTPYPQTEFGGLDLRAAADSSACIDMLNVDLDRPGAIRVRDGYDNFTSGAGSARYRDLVGFTTSGGAQQIVAARWADAGTTITLEAFDNAGASITTQAGAATGTAPDFAVMSFANFAAPGSTLLYMAGMTIEPDRTRGATGAFKWSGTAFTSVALSTEADTLVGVQPTENRLVTAAASTHPARVRFSDAGVPETFSANNYVDLAPGDGGEIRALATWRDKLIVFKSSPRYFVFYGNAVAASGDPIFQYEQIDAPAAMVNWGAAVARDGVYFVTRRGVYRTTGGPPELVSSALDPLFRGVGLSSFSQTSAVNQTELEQARIAFHDERIYVAVPTGTSAYNDTLLVFDPRTDEWLVWNIPCSGLCSAQLSYTGRAELIFSYATGSNHIGRHAPAYSNDDSAAIVSRYRAGFGDYGSQQDKSADLTYLWGTGTPGFAWSADFGSLDGAQTVTLGTSPAIDRGSHRYGRRGTLLSWQVSASSGAWTVHRVVPHFDDAGLPGDLTA